MKQNITPKNDKNQRHGLWIAYTSNNIWSKGYFINDIRYGYWYRSRFNPNDKITFYLR